MDQLSLKSRLFIGIPAALVFIGISAMFYLGGLVIGIMGTDGCQSIPNWASVYLVTLWPAVMFVSSVIPPSMFIKNVKWIWVMIALFIGIMVSVLWYFGWFFILSVICY
ncbi:MAG: hypothetical protein ISS16_07645 [Ignavibacteria bacterium]|nr:hypothetical protein [Bacteroidota bacterium]MBL7128842.1 hypothetical protein [Ignavibacteria bacterium]